MAKKKMTVEQIDASLARWQTKLKRAVNTIERLQKQRKRLAKATPPKLTEAERIAEPVIRKLAGMPAPTGAMFVPAVPASEPAPTPAKSDDLAIPTFLKRNAADDAAADQIREEQAERKRAKSTGRIARLKADKSGERRRMPLSGKAALAAIRGA